MPVLFSVPDGIYSKPQRVELSTPTTGATIHYTIDNSTPTTMSPIYATAVVVDTNRVLKAIAVKSGLANSPGSSAKYKIWKDTGFAGIPWNDAITFGKLYDPRDNKTYRSVVIGDQTWMAENLNYKPAGADSGWCYMNKADSCLKYGRYYTWEASMQHVSSSSEYPSGIQGICPQNWHLPSDAEWQKLNVILITQGTSVLMAATGELDSYRNGTDDYGFRVLPGYYYSGVGFDRAIPVYWWSSTEPAEGIRMTHSIAGDLEAISTTMNPKSSGYPVRCIKN
jgi:uncharacterized protein (TIGR02145 family)